MKAFNNILLIFLLVTYTEYLNAQDTIFGIGIYASGTETGFGYRSSKDTRFAADIRITKASIFSDPLSGGFINEASLIYRVAYYERVRFHIGIGGRAEWNFSEDESHHLGIATPLGVEAFPFPFQNAGLFFEATPYFTNAINKNIRNSGIRTVAGFVFYFITDKRKDAD